MYNVLLVDDERIILEGIASVVEWNKHGTRLAGKAVNGMEALRHIEAMPPDIVITDIRMPELGGIELIQWAKERYPGMIFIVLSGHEEFSSAQTAMKLGVRHYLLKPCTEDEIEHVLVEAVEELQERQRQESFRAATMEQLARVLPQIKEQFLKECLMNKTYSKRDWDYYGGLLGLDIEGRAVRLLLFEIEGSCEFEHLFALHNIAEELVRDAGQHVLLNTTIGDRLVLLVEDGELARWLTLLERVKQVYGQYFRLDLTIAVSHPGSITQLRYLYRETLACLSHRFYLGEGSIITSEDILHPVEGLPMELEVDAEAFAIAVRSGNLERVHTFVRDTIIKLKASKLDVGLVKSCVLELYLVLLREKGSAKPAWTAGSHSANNAGPGCSPDAADMTAAGTSARIKPMLGLESYLLREDAFDTLDQTEDYLLQAAAEVAMRNYEANMQTQSKVIDQVIRYVAEHLPEESLTLSKLAHDIFYLNVDYLGKLFRKETGEKFSQYMIRVRMEEAMRLIAAAEYVKILDIAAKVGFRSNPQYFSQVFKKHTGLTPSEYMKQLSIMPEK
ncbi:two-component system response regulator YesN [Paenibacillus phyllosphaerae]|uniref:Two-component system response regulator YesN n=1 Tax=Paenibacillus phyllosphaerae TaxID=274593 RepID=A0A7W5B0Z2_9BACL|nr:response regulator [Paenibacillus phyllosphaerae]MBB3111696.1 two-component system response regulator YesN [Paenibacillus phyllosphaerae]